MKRSSGSSSGTLPRCACSTRKRGSVPPAPSTSLAPPSTHRARHCRGSASAPAGRSAAAPGTSDEIRTPVEMRVGAPAEMLGAVEDLFDSHFENDVGMSADPRPAPPQALEDRRCHLAQHQAHPLLPVECLSRQGSLRHRRPAPHCGVAAPPAPMQPVYRASVPLCSHPQPCRVTRRRRLAKDELSTQRLSQTTQSSPLRPESTLPVAIPPSGEISGLKR